MGFELHRVKNFGGGWNMAGKACHSCNSTAATIFCRSHSAFLCLHCDSKLHSSPHNLPSRHERVLVCEVCEHAPASVTCKADAAALCVACDADIHSANPLASRHERVPVEPFFDSNDYVAKPSSFAAVSFLDSVAGDVDCFRSDDTKAGSWLFQNTDSSSKLLDCNELKSGEVFFSEMDFLIDVEYPELISSNSAGAPDCVVPVHSRTLSSRPQIRNPEESSFEIDFSRSTINSYRYPTQSSTSQSVSSSSLEVGVVPDRIQASDISPPFIRNFINISDRNATSPAATNKATIASGSYREARVLRYREKRKNRRFEKTIRYASRKAYAETRPRIKGRFAKRKEIEEEEEEEEDCVYSPARTPFISDTQYGVVPFS